MLYGPVRTQGGARSTLHAEDLGAVSARKGAIFQSRLGWCCVVVRDGDLCRIRFGYATRDALHAAITSPRSGPDSSLSDIDWTDPGRLPDGGAVVDRLVRRLAGERVSLDDIAVDWWGRTPFQRQVLDACRAIPWGDRVTYGELARRVGRPRAARAVGAAMSSNRVPLVVPCHRVVGRDGRLVGFTSPRGLTMKETLLRHESLSPDGT